MVTLGRSGLSCSALGLGSSYGLDAADVEYAFDRGCNYFYWGSRRRSGFGGGLRALAARGHREQLVIVVQSYQRVGLGLGPSLDSALRRLRTDYADILLLGWWNAMPPARILDAAVALRDQGKCRALMISCHHRPSFRAFIDSGVFDAIMVRYNAAHRGAETEVFPDVAAAGAAAPGVVAYTATRWGALLDPALAPPGARVPTATDCYRFALSDPRVNVCLSGPGDRRELDAALAALDAGPLPTDELAWMREVGDHVRATAMRSALRNPANWADSFGSRLRARLRLE